MTYVQTVVLSVFLTLLLAASVACLVWISLTKGDDHPLTEEEIKRRIDQAWGYMYYIANGYLNALPCVRYSAPVVKKAVIKKGGCMELSLMAIFFTGFCGTDGSIPDCRGCEHNNKNMGCDHTENPMNKKLSEVKTPCSCATA